MAREVEVGEPSRVGDPQLAARALGKAAGAPRANVEWFHTLPANMHEEQKDFLAAQLGLSRD